jgi:hypothetical protein
MSTSIVVNNPSNIFIAKMIGVEPVIYRCRGCNTNLNGNSPAQQYQRLKLIQNTVRVYSSLYSMNLAALNAYEIPDSNYQVVNIPEATYIASPGVNWNQMSDRRQPHTQFANASGSTYGGNSLKRTLTRLRPGALSPGGSGVDIKHNSYDRYLNRLKGKAPVRRGIIPPNFGAPIPFNRAFPIYGGKTTKTSIVSNCYCPILSSNLDSNLNSIYNNGSVENELNNMDITFQVGGYIYALRNNIYVKALIIAINDINTTFTIQYEDGTTDIQDKSELLIYLPCNNCDV